jgi:Sec-independent protein secretion pathway component TatC
VIPGVDVITMLLELLPLIGLYELGILRSAALVKRPAAALAGT